MRASDRGQEQTPKKDSPGGRYYLIEVELLLILWKPVV
jgi:hypothetical protein